MVVGRGEENWPTDTWVQGGAGTHCPGRRGGGLLEELLGVQAGAPRARGDVRGEGSDRRSLWAIF